MRTNPWRLQPTADTVTAHEQTQVGQCKSKISGDTPKQERQLCQQLGCVIWIKPSCIQCPTTGALQIRMYFVFSISTKGIGATLPLQGIRKEKWVNGKVKHGNEYYHYIFSWGIRQTLLSWTTIRWRLRKMLLEGTEGGSTYLISANENCVSTRV